jgi:6-phosphogluconolactonase
MMEAEIVVVADAGALAQEAAARFVSLAQEATEARGRFSVALAGGSTPRGLYERLGEVPYRNRVPWTQVHLFWGDERLVAPDDPGSNYRLAAETFVVRVPLPPENVHRMAGELAPEAAVRAYRRALEDFFCGPRPRFDLVLLGLGSDGHTASLFAGAEVLEEKGEIVAAVEADYEGRPAGRLTLTLPAINSARQVLFMVAGEDKAGIVREVLEGPAGRFPAQRVAPNAGHLTWLLDAGSASALRGVGYR